MEQIRRAGREDAGALADLILLSDSGLLPILFGPDAVGALRYLAGRSRNPFSFTHGWIVEVDRETAGAAVGSAARSIRSESLPTAWLVVRYFAVNAPARLLRLRRASAATSRLGASDFYLSNIAVFPAYQGRGHGRQLLLAVEREADATGCERIVLDVDPDNARAAAFYEKLGYREEGRVTITIRDGVSFSYRRLAKRLN